MRLVFGLVMLIGIVLAGAAVYLARDFIGQQQAQLAAAEAAKKAIVPTADVYVVIKQKRYGQRLTLEDVKKVRWPKAAIPEGTFTSEEDLFPKGTDVPRSVLRTLEAGEAVMEVKVTGAGEDAGVSARLSPGNRAFAIRTDVTSGVSGFLRPGDRVDVYWTGSIRGGRNVTKLIEANVRLVAINQSADEDRSGAVVARTVTVEVSPHQVAALAQAQSSGRLSLSLVGADDNIVSSDVEVDQRRLLGIQEEQVVQEERKCFIKKRVNGELVDTAVRTQCTN
ncbi:MAG: Flp pilus assembly protein CpaB [Silicimonas sp.]|nr:Flp pilus assembly protein CpaB [Silicimonas sp.]